MTSHVRHVSYCLFKKIKTGTFLSSAENSIPPEEFFLYATQAPLSPSTLFSSSDRFYINTRRDDKLLGFLFLSFSYFFLLLTLFPYIFNIIIFQKKKKMLFAGVLILSTVAQTVLAAQFRVIAQGGNDVQVSINGMNTKLSAPDADVPYFVGEVDAQPNSRYKVNLKKKVQKLKSLIFLF